MDVSIVIPTYKERENLPELLDQLFNVFDSIKNNCEIIIVDDNSEDGTYEFIENNKWRHTVKLVTRYKEKGLASACVTGFNFSRGDIILVMDADLQHPPEKIKDLINIVETKADIAIGSRYTEKGEIGKWSIHRKLISKGASFLFNLFFPDVKISDTQSGFFAFNKKVIKNVDLKPRGYKILLEILVHGNYEKIEETGIVFGKRHKGDSKLNATIIFSYVAHIFHLLWSSGKLSTLIKFSLVGLSGVVVNLGTLYILTSMGLFYLLSGLIAVELSLLTNFFVNRLWTFKKISGRIRFTHALFKDHLVRSVGMVIKLACLFVLTNYLGLFYILSMLIGIAIATMWNFLGNIRWVWRGKNE